MSSHSSSFLLRRKTPRLLLGFIVNPKSTPRPFCSSPKPRPATAGRNPLGSELPGVAAPASGDLPDEVLEPRGVALARIVGRVQSAGSVGHPETAKARRPWTFGGEAKASPRILILAKERGTLHYSIIAFLLRCFISYEIVLVWRPQTWLVKLRAHAGIPRLAAPGSKGRPPCIFSLGRCDLFICARKKRWVPLKEMRETCNLVHFQLRVMFQRACRNQRPERWVSFCGFPPVGL